MHNNVNVRNNTELYVSNGYYDGKFCVMCMSSSQLKLLFSFFLGKAWSYSSANLILWCNLIEYGWILMAVPTFNPLQRAVLIEVYEE